MDYRTVYNMHTSFPVHFAALACIARAHVALGAHSPARVPVVDIAVKGLEIRLARAVQTGEWSDTYQVAVQRCIRDARYYAKGGDFDAMSNAIANGWLLVREA